MAISFVWGATYTLVSAPADDQGLLAEGDAFWYSSMAFQVAEGQWFEEPFGGTETASHPPVTVFVLAVPATFSDSVLLQRLTMALAGAVGVGVIGLFGREVGGPRLGLVSAAIAVVVPSLWINQSLLMSEAPATVAYASLLLVGARAARVPTTRNAAILGAVAGVAMLTRAEAALFLPLMALPVLLVPPGPVARRVARVAVAGVAALVVIAPWIAYNVSRFEEPVFISTNDGITLAGANCDETYETAAIGGWSLDCAGELIDRDRDESQNGRALRRAGLDHAGDNLDRLPMVVTARITRTFGLWRPDQSVGYSTGEGRPRMASWAALVTFWAMVPASVIGARVLRERTVTLWPFAAALLTPIVVSAMFNGNVRHRLPLDIAMCVLVAVALLRLSPEGSERGHGEDATA